MIKTQACLICGNTRPEYIDAVVTPFLVQRCHITEDVQSVKQCWCPKCDFVFFDHRLTDEETRLLYSDYREGSYDELRLRLEPEYQSWRLLFSEKNNRYHQDRIDQLRSFFMSSRRTFKRILDFGGGKDGWLSKAAFPDSTIDVFDLANGGTMATPGEYDLVLCAHTLEHVSFPLSFLQQMHESVPIGKYLYLEVPMEYTGSLKDTFRSTHLKDMHEHLSGFTPRALVRLLHRAGFMVVHMATLNYESYKGQSIAVLSKRKPKLNLLEFRETCVPGFLPLRTGRTYNPLKWLFVFVRYCERKWRHRIRGKVRFKSR